MNKGKKQREYMVWFEVFMQPGAAGCRMANAGKTDFGGWIPEEKSQGDV